MRTAAACIAAVARTAAVAVLRRLRVLRRWLRIVGLHHDALRDWHAGLRSRVGDFNLEGLASNDARRDLHLVLGAVCHNLDALTGARAHGALNLHEAHRTLGRSWPLSHAAFAASGR